jgi:multifunctional 2-oxoglutarate metabolism enzyme
MSVLSAQLQAILEEFGPNAGLVEELLREYLDNPASVSRSWQQFFAGALQASPGGGNGAKPPAVVEQTAPPPAPTVPEDAIAMRGAAARIVENMEASLSLPTATSLRTIPVKVLEENRRLLNHYLAAATGTRVSFTHVIAWAIVSALHDHPALNASFARIGGVPHRTARPQINIGLAIDLTRRDGTRSLVVPNIKDAGNLTFDRFLRAYDEIVGKARASALEPSDFQETSITLTNPGTVGTISSVPRLMPGQGAIIATGAIQYPVEHQGMPPEALSAMGLSKVMAVTCTYDHRVIQGAQSGEFLARVHELLLGEDAFYDRLFADLRIPYEPFRWITATTPAAGRLPDAPEQIEKQARVLQLINAYRVRGHLIAHLDPLVHEPLRHPELDPATYGLTMWDFDRTFVTGGLAGRQHATLRTILEILRETYCGTTGIEYMFIQHPAQKEWLQERLEPPQNRAPLAKDLQKRILKTLITAEGLERFLHTKFIGHKRFSLEGAETLMPILEFLLDDAAAAGAEEVVIGMAHRGRLNVLVNTVGRSLARLFSEFEGYVDPSTTQGSGDVKYHLGARGVHRSSSGRDIAVTLSPNPSHLEAVNPVVEGIARAGQERRGDTDRERVIPVLIHGDAAFAGQGIVAETLNLSQLHGYRTGGTVHLIINNQIGFTTLPDDARSTPYCTDVARMVQAPIIHVNGDDPEACIRAARLAFAYRQEFKKDVVVDMFCFRRHGHNEGDEPSYTQPLLYKTIRRHPSVREVYGATLVRLGVLSEEEIAAMSDESKTRYERAFEASQKREMHFRADVPLAVSTAELEAAQPARTTAVPEELLAEVTRGLTTLPSDFRLHPKLQRMLDERRLLLEGNGTIDWSFAEALAFGTLVAEGTGVRLSGQDSGRGTFSQRHLVLYDAQSGSAHVPLTNIRQGQAPFAVYDSLLSEAAVLGFEFGYSAADPLTLVIWEAQFGDFANGAQVYIDQFIAGSESKWQVPSDIVLLLPHGYEGQGPEHSSARLERFLQLCAEDNLQVCNCSTPAQYFHLLRRQMRDGRRKPLVVMTPKSLLRHPKAVSTAADLTSGMFRTVIPDGTTTTGEARRTLVCSGKVYYDLLAGRSTHKAADIAIIRLEQLYPFPADELSAAIGSAGTNDVVWIQEEPMNMGGWTYLEQRLRESGGPAANIRYLGRPPGASTATGSLKVHQEEQDRLVAAAFS